MSETRTTRHHHTNCAIHGTLVGGKLRDCTCTATPMSETRKDWFDDPESCPWKCTPDAPTCVCRFPNRAPTPPEQGEEGETTVGGLSEPLISDAENAQNIAKRVLEADREGRAFPWIGPRQTISLAQYALLALARVAPHDGLDAPATIIKHLRGTVKPHTHGEYGCDCGPEDFGVSNEMADAISAHWDRAVLSVDRATPPAAETGEDDDDGDNVALQVICRAFDNWEPIYERWLAYDKSQWLWWGRALGGFLCSEIDALAAPAETWEPVAWVPRHTSGAYAWMYARETRDEVAHELFSLGLIGYEIVPLYAAPAQREVSEAMDALSEVAEDVSRLNVAGASALAGRIDGTVDKLRVVLFATSTKTG